MSAGEAQHPDPWGAIDRPLLLGGGQRLIVLTEDVGSRHALESTGCEPNLLVQRRIGLRCETAVRGGRILLAEIGEEGRSRTRGGDMVTRTSLPRLHAAGESLVRPERVAASFHHRLAVPRHDRREVDEVTHLRRKRVGRGAHDHAAHRVADEYYGLRRSFQQPVYAGDVMRQRDGRAGAAVRSMSGKVGHDDGVAGRLEQRYDALPTPRTVHGAVDQDVSAHGDGCGSCGARLLVSIQSTRVRSSRTWQPERRTNQGAGDGYWATCRGQRGG